MGGVYTEMGDLAERLWIASPKHSSADVRRPGCLPLASHIAVLQTLRHLKGAWSKNKNSLWQALYFFISYKPSKFKKKKKS